ncbi:hypothetical protein M0804_001739 [Polistes exclamans]|nr:hypothetical protein M0804_001739 [Polistes exclamans]
MYCVQKGAKKIHTYSKRLKISGRPLNRHELEAPSELNTSTSAKTYDIEVNLGFSYCMINFIGVFSAISNVVVCKVYKSQVKFTESDNRGLELKIEVSCDKCV